MLEAVGDLSSAKFASLLQLAVGSAFERRSFSSTRNRLRSIETIRSPPNHWRMAEFRTDFRQLHILARVYPANLFASLEAHRQKRQCADYGPAVSHECTAAAVHHRNVRQSGFAIVCSNHAEAAVHNMQAAVQLHGNTTWRMICTLQNQHGEAEYDTERCCTMGASI